MSAGYKTGSNRKQHVGIGWLGCCCCLGACAPSVTLESPHDRCSSLMSLKGRIRVFFLFFFCLFPTRPTALHTSYTWQRFTVLEQMAQHTAVHVK